MKIKFTLARTAEWMAAYAIRTGENAPSEVVVEVDSVVLGEERRKVLVDYFGLLPDAVGTLMYDIDLEWSRYASYGRCQLYTQAETPGYDDAIAAFDGALAALETRRAEYAVEQAARDAEDARKKAEVEALNRRIAEARELLSSELEGMTMLKTYRAILSDVLSELTPAVLSAAVAESSYSEKEVYEACEYSLTFANEVD